MPIKGKNLPYKGQQAIKKEAHQAAFLQGIEQHGNIFRAAKDAGIDRTLHYVKWGNDPEYAKKFDDANKKFAHNMENEARRRAMDGVRRAKFYRGKPIIDPETGKQYFEHEYSDTLMIFLLKGELPEKYGDKARVDLSGTLTFLSPEPLDKPASAGESDD